MIKMQNYRIMHAKQNMYLGPTETFVHARVLNPVCTRPVPVMTDQVTAPYEGAKEIKVYKLAALNPLLQRIILAIGYRFHWNAYYFEILRRLRPQLIHAHFSGAGEDCLLSARILNIPLVVNFYGIETNYHIQDSVWIARYQRIYDNSDGLICSSNHMKAEMIKSGCPEKKIHVVRCGVDTDFFTGEVTKWKRGEPLLILSIARLHPEKGLANLLLACSLLKEHGFANWQLSMVGNGPLESQLRKQVISLGIEEQVIFLGNKTPTGTLNALRNAHLLILPSLKETQGIVLQEAQASCTPVIASNTGGIPEGVVDGSTGLLVAPGSPESIALAIDTFVNNPNLLITMGKAGRRFVEEKFSRRAEHEQLSDIYQSYVH
jgi:colanic acid/amylovoran biosynthesis glycosyltransferase